MFKKFKLVMLLVAVLPAIAMTAHQVQTDEDETESNVEKKYKVSVCTLFKNEASYLREWLEYHQMVGVDHFYLYDNGSTDRSFDVLKPYIRKGMVTLVRWPDRMPNTDGEGAEHWVLSTQLPAYENASKWLAAKDTEWLVFLDIDEFIVPVRANTVGEVLEDYSDFPGLQLTSDYFDASFKDALSAKELLIANVDLTGRPVQNIIKSVEKTIFKPDCNTSFTWPPYKCNFKDNKSAALLSKRDLRINKYVHRNESPLNFRKIKQRLRVDSRALTENEKTELLEVGYEIEDKERAVSRFESGLRKRMGIESGWNR